MISMTPRAFASRASLALGMVPVLAARAAADHPGDLRSEMSPLTQAVLMGGLALATVLLVVVVAMLLTRKDLPEE